MLLKNVATSASRVRDLVLLGLRAFGFLGHRALGEERVLRGVLGHKP